MKRLNKEYKLDVCNHVLVKYGSVNKENPQVVYISGKCWISPLQETDYDSVINEVEREMRNNIKMFLIDEYNFCGKYILDFDVCSDNMCVGVNKFLSFDFFVRQNDKNKKQLKDLIPILSKRVSTIVNGMVYSFNENGFSVSKRKTRL